jgi:hypothetical protein
MKFGWQGSDKFMFQLQHTLFDCVIKAKIDSCSGDFA